MLYRLKTHHYSTRSLVCLIVLYLFALLFSAIFSPVVYHLVQWWAEHFPNSLNQYLINKSFADYFDRVRWIPIAMGLIWFSMVGKVSIYKSQSRSDYSVAKNYLRGVLFGTFLITAILLIQFLCSDVVYKEDALVLVELKTIIRKALISALVVSFLEEIVFRGIVLQACYSALKPYMAVFLNAFIFTYMHFKMPDSVWEKTDQVVDWKSGIFVAIHTLIGIFHSFNLPLILNLFAVGVFLSILMIRTTSLACCMGVHAVFVFFILVYNKILQVDAVSVPQWLIGSQRVMDGFLPCILLSVASIILLFKNKKHAL